MSRVPFSCGGGRRRRPVRTAERDWCYLAGKERVPGVHVYDAAVREALSALKGFDRSLGLRAEGAARKSVDRMPEPPQPFLYRAYAGPLGGAPAELARKRRDTRPTSVGYLRASPPARAVVDMDESRIPADPTNLPQNAVGSRCHSVGLPR